MRGRETGLPLWDATPEHAERPVLVVQTPGFAREAFLPLVHALRADGSDVNVLSFPCDEVDVAASVRAAAEGLGPEVVVVAHGVGATLALRSGADVAAWVLLAPVLDVWPTEALSAAAALPVGPSVDLRVARAWNEHDLRAVLLGDPVPALGCAPVALVAEVQGWVRDGAVPLVLEGLDAPVWIAVSLGDDVASVEATVPAARRINDVRLVRFGRNGFDPEDYDHAGLLDGRRPVRAAARAVRRLR